MLYVAVTRESSALARKTPVNGRYERCKINHWFCEIPKTAIVTVNATETVDFRSFWAAPESLGSGKSCSERSNGHLSSLYSSIECMDSKVNRIDTVGSSARKVLEFDTVIGFHNASFN